MTRYVSFAAAILFGCALNFQMLRPVISKPAVDFAQFYFAGELIAEGNLDKLYDTQTYQPLVEEVQATGQELRPFVYFNRPAFAAPVLGLLAASYTTGATTFLLLNFAAWAFLIWKLPICWTHHVPCASGCSLSSAAWAIGVGQDTIGLTVIAAYAMRLSASHEVAAGMLLGLGLAKPHLFTLIPVLFLSRAEIQGAVSFLATGLVLAGVSVAFVDRMDLRSGLNCWALQRRTITRRSWGRSERWARSGLTLRLRQP